MNINTDMVPGLYRHDLFSKKVGGSRFLPTKMDPAEIIWWCFAVCVTLGNINAFFGEFSGPLSYVLAIGGSAGCAWAWLFTRSLFRPDGALARWPFILLAATIAFEGAWEITNGLATTGEAQRIIANGASFLCIALLALVFVEALTGYDRNRCAKERRFRQIYVGSFAAILSVTMFWALGAPEGSLASQTEMPTRLAFGALVIIGGRFAIEFRKKHQLISAAYPAPRHAARSQTADASCHRLAERIRAGLEKDQFFATPQLKISDLSAAIGEPDYKVTQCITGAMGYPNFNRLVNAYRIENAKTALRNERNNDRQILAIALECGFNSIGPFNRAFKQEVGMTPREFRST